MFEEEAENSFNGKKVLYKSSTDKRSYIDGFKDGAEFGYNKAKKEYATELKEVVETCNHWQEVAEKANEWHYMKDGDFPPENVPLNIITFDKDKKRRLWEGEYKGGNGQWWTGYFNHFIDVPYAWKEIELPKEIKEND